MHDPSIDDDQASAANAHFAARMGPGQLKRLAQEIRQSVRGSTLHDTLLPLTVMLTLIGSLTAPAS